MKWRTAICTLSIVLLAGCGSRTAEQQTGIGETHLVLGEIAKAESAFREAIAADPGHSRAHLGLARCLAMSGNSVGALDAYTEASKSPETVVAASFEAADLTLKDGTADTWVDTLEKADSDAAAVLRAYIARRNGDNDMARSMLEQARGTPALELAWLEAMERNFDRAAEMHEALVDSPSAEMLAAELHAQGIEAIEAPSADVAQAWIAARHGDLKIAKQNAEPLSRGPNATPWANAVLGYCALVEGAPREAERLLRLAAYELPHALVVRDLLDKSRDAVSAPQVIAEVPTEAVQESWIELWNAGRLRLLLLNADRWDDSPETAETLYIAALTSGNMNVSATLADQLAPDSVLTAYASAMTAALQGEPKALLEVVRSWSPSTERETVLMRNAAARAYAIAQLRARALEQILRAIADAPENGVALYNLATLYREAEMPAHEIESWRRLSTRFPQNEEALERVYALLIQERRFGEARRVAEAAYVSNPDDIASLIRLADASFKSGDAAFAMTALEKAAEVHPANRTVARALARGHLVVSDGSAALEALERFPDEHDLRAYALTLVGEFSEARATCESGGNEPMLRAALMTQAEAFDEASFVLDGITPTPALNPWLAALRLRKNADADVSELGLALGARSDVLGAYALGAALSNHGLAKAAIEAWQTVADEIGLNTELTMLMLAEFARTGAIKEKTLAARTLAERHAADPMVWVALADVYDSAERHAGKSEALEKAALLVVDSAQVWTAIAQRIDASNQSMLLNAFENLYRLQPNDPIVRNNYAYALIQAGRTNPNPLQLAQAAADALGARSHVLHTLGLALMQSGQLDEGRTKLYQAVEQRPGDPTLMLDFGKALIAQGETTEGRRLVEASIAYADRLRVDFPRRAEAEALLANEAA